MRTHAVTGTLRPVRRIGAQKFALRPDVLSKESDRGIRSIGPGNTKGFPRHYFCHGKSGMTVEMVGREVVMSLPLVGLCRELDLDAKFPYSLLTNHIAR